MIVLALDTTTRAGSLALARDGEVVEVFQGDASRTHAARLPGDLVDCLARHRLSLADVDLFAVAAGPGSFTGLRIGIATIQGLAFANHRQVVGVSALEALALSALGLSTREDAGDLLVGAWMDAQRQEVYAQLFRGPASRPGRASTAPTSSLQPLDAPAVGSPTVMLEVWQAQLVDVAPGELVLVGDGVLAYRDLVTSGLPQGHALEVVPPLAPAIAAIARQRAEAGLAVPPHAIKPIYVRRPDAELARERHRRHGSGEPSSTPASSNE